MRAKTQRLPDDNLAAILEPADPADANYSGTKVVVTVGPACQSVEALCALLEAGASAARIDLTWGPIEYHRRSLDNLQEAMRRTRRLCAVVLDTLGREIMVRRPFRIDPDGWPNQVSWKKKKKTFFFSSSAPPRFFFFSIARPRQKYRLAHLLLLSLPLKRPQKPKPTRSAKRSPSRRATSSP
jgi:hypothetical protein